MSSSGNANKTTPNAVNQPKTALPTNVVTEKTIEEFFAEIKGLQKLKEEYECSLKSKTNESRKWLAEIAMEKERLALLQETANKVEEEKKELQRKLDASNNENDELNEELKKTQAAIAECDRYIIVLVHENDGRLNLAEQFKVFDAPAKDAAMRNTLKRNSTGNTTLQAFQETNKISG